MNCVSLYSGADNLGDGVIQAGHKIILAIEKDKDCCETIRLNHPDIEVICGTVAEHLESLPQADCVIGGPPCPEFSAAKHNKSYDLCEVNNFNKAREICKAPHHFMENVPLMSKVYNHRNFLINAADYGVPQSRERRIFTDFALPKPTHTSWIKGTMSGKPFTKWQSVKEALDIPEGWHLSPTGFSKRNAYIVSKSVQAPSLTITNGCQFQFTDRYVKSTKHSEQDHNVIRNLTNKELAILQGFRPDFEFYGSKSSVKKQIANALPASVSREFFKLVL